MAKGLFFLAAVISLAASCGRTCAVGRLAYNGYALAHPKGLVAFLPLKSNKEKKQLPTNAVLSISLFFTFLGGVWWVVNNFICVYQVYGVYLYCN